MFFLRQTTYKFLTDEEFSKLGNTRNQQVGLLSICSELIKQGYDVTYQSPLSEEEVNIERLAQAEVVGFSTITANIHSAKNIARKVKKINPKIITVVGGYHTPVLYEQYLGEDSPFDFILGGHSEKRLPQLLNDIENGKDPYNIPEISFRKDGKIFHNIAVDSAKLSELELPANYLVEKDLIGARVFSTYGCPYSCKFCHTRIDPYSEKKLEKFREEVEYLITEKGTKYVYVADATFGINKKRARKIIDILNELGVHWGCQTRIDVLDDYLLSSIADSNNVELDLGVESMVPIELKLSNKRITPEKIREVIDKVLGYDVNLLTYWISGLPGINSQNAEQDLEEMEQLVKRNVHIQLSTLVPYPQTYYFQRQKESGIRIEDTNWSNYYEGAFHTYSITYPYPQSRQQLFNLYKSALTRLTEAVTKQLKPELRNKIIAEDLSMGWLF